MPPPSRRCGVLGDPIAHSLSPVLHRAGYAATGLDWGYEAHRVPAGGLAAFVGSLDGSWAGLSVTMPLKLEAHARADRLTPLAELSGVVNTLVLGDEVVGDNTDLPGAVAAVRERTPAELTTAVVLGGGATATSVGLALAELGVRHLRVAVRSPERAAGTVETVRAHPAAPAVEVVLLDELAAGRGDSAVPDLVASTVPVGVQSPALVERLASAPCVFDVLYDPWPTPLAAAAQGVVVSGLDLLVHQAALQFSLFTGRPAPLAAMREAGERALAARGGAA